MSNEVLYEVKPCSSFTLLWPKTVTTCFCCFFDNVLPGWLEGLMRAACRNLWQKKEKKWLEHQLAFSLILAETTHNRFYSTADFCCFHSKPLQCYIEEENCVKSDVEHSDTHAIVNRADTFWRIWICPARKVFRWTASSWEIEFKENMNPIDVDLWQSTDISLFSHLHRKIIHHLT